MKRPVVFDICNYVNCSKSWYICPHFKYGTIGHSSEVFMCKSVMLCAVPMPVDSKEACSHTASAQTHFSSLPAECLDVLNKSVRECLIPVGLDGLPLQLNVQPLNFLSTQTNTTQGHHRWDKATQLRAHATSDYLSLLASSWCFSICSN